MSTGYSPALAADFDAYYNVGGLEREIKNTTTKNCSLRGQIPYGTECVKNIDTDFTGPLRRDPLMISPMLTDTFAAGLDLPSEPFSLSLDKPTFERNEPILYAPRPFEIENPADRQTERIEFMKRMHDPRRIYLSRYAVQKDIARTQFFRTPEYVRTEGRKQTELYPSSFTEFY